jgi:hypothetical protein
VGCDLYFVTWCSYTQALYICLLHHNFFFCNPWFGHKVLPPVWIFALRPCLQLSCSIVHAVYLCYDPPCFRCPSCCDGVFCPCGWWCVEMCVFLLTVRRFRLWLCCGFLVGVYFVALLLLSFSCWLHLVYQCCAFSCAAAFRGFGVTFLYSLVFRRVRKVAKRDYYLCRVCLLFRPPVRLSRPSVCMEQLRPHWTDFHEIWYLSIFKSPVEKMQFWLISDKNSGHFT